MESLLKKSDCLFNVPFEEFKTITKYLLFCMPVVALPIGGNYANAFTDAIQAAGKV